MSQILYLDFERPCRGNDLNTSFNSKEPLNLQRFPRQFVCFRSIISDMSCKNVSLFACRWASVAEKVSLNETFLFNCSSTANISRSSLGAHTGNFKKTSMIYIWRNNGPEDFDIGFIFLHKVHAG